MALGIGASTAVFSVVHAVLLNPLPYPKAGRIVTLTYGSSGGFTGERSLAVSLPDFADWQAQAGSFEEMAYYSTGRASVMAGTVAEYAVTSQVTGGFFRIFGVQPSPGRVSSESGYWVDRMPKESPLSQARPAVMNVVAPGTFAALRIPIRHGRDFGDNDVRDRPQVCIVNEALARAAFQGRDPLGRILSPDTTPRSR